MAGNIAVGVISGAPAYLMNADSEGQAVALKGRVPVKVAGEVSKGQAVYVDDNGVATASNTGSDMVGIALESNGDSGVKLVECILKV
jgi:predicted RecA/RadA family phage recombinase